MANPPNKQYGQQGTQGETDSYGPLAGTRSFDLPAGAPVEILRSEAGRVQEMAQDMDGHGPEPQHEARLVEQEQVTGSPWPTNSKAMPLANRQVVSTTTRGPRTRSNKGGGPLRR